MSVTIELYNKNTGEMEWVRCWETATPHFVITQPMVTEDPDFNLDDLYNVTHVRSTALAIGPFKSMYTASLCAAIMGYLPVPWQDFSPAVSNQFKEPDAELAARFKAAWSSLPLEIHKWIQAVAQSCALGEI